MIIKEDGEVTPGPTNKTFWLPEGPKLPITGNVFRRVKELRDKKKLTNPEVLNKYK